MSTLRRLTLASLSFAIPLAVAAAQPPQTATDTLQSDVRLQQQHSPRPLTLEAQVRKGTEPFRFFKNALDAGWHTATPCVSGPNEGAMGVHFIKGVADERFHDGDLNPEDPELLIYEPLGNGFWKLVGVEFIQYAEDWKNRDPNGDGSPPNLDGHLMNFVDTPNRYGLPAFYELHVWAWEDNPLGTFADWNIDVNCDKWVPPPPMK